MIILLFVLLAFLFYARKIEIELQMPLIGSYYYYSKNKYIYTMLSRHNHKIVTLYRSNIANLPYVSYKGYLEYDHELDVYIVSDPQKGLCSFTLDKVTDITVSGYIGAEI